MSVFFFGTCQAHSNQKAAFRLFTGVSQRVFAKAACAKELPGGRRLATRSSAFYRYKNRDER